MITYIAFTTTCDKYEIAPGIYLIRAEDESDAHKITELCISKHESVTEIKDIESLLRSDVNIIDLGRCKVLQNPLVE